MGTVSLPWSTRFISLCCAIAFAWTALLAQGALVVVKTNAGAGADGRVTENVSGVGPTGAVSAGSGTSGTATIDVRWNGTLTGNKDRNEWGAFRFDLSPASLGGASRSQITGAELWLVYQRTGPQNGTINFFGINGNVTGEDSWSEATMSFNNMPGLKFDGTTDSSSDATTSAAGRVLADSTLLGTLTLTSQVKPPSVASVEAGGTGVVKLADANLLSFLTATDTDDLVTFLVGTETSPTSTQLRFASKELTSLESGSPTGIAGDFAARLVLDIVTVPEPAGMMFCGVATLGLLGISFSTMCGGRRRRGAVESGNR